MATDKKILVKGLKYMGWALPLFFIGPSVIHSSFKNQEHPLYIPVLGLGIIFCLLAIFMVAIGLKTIMKSLFENES
ncbi:hypothetical protein E0W68_05800 [Flavobacterium salilacus subsp. salilacus]|uniref:DUF6095 family protein n=1 Tax=Flavobacterium TaxID=237 RepID=UPI00107516AF|nr:MULTISPECIES: DUF6095 family protein [Flavobacterium]KAF2519280.1 hypothetical protein E0W68_05800 [Flavobacterium salilacus subsp. salilacus]MBE1613465.1 hypothetical protein [Flavobacterium sp. SaA2.13]NDI98795.1 hypothetical protein [Flavobacterium salilacus subsp. altitudinum]